MVGKLTLNRKLVALGAFLLLGLSPSYVDWQQSPEKRPMMVGYYAVTGGMLWFGLLK